MYRIDRLCTYLSSQMRLKPYRIYFFYLQIVLMSVAIGSTAWNLVAEIKSHLLGNTATELNAWTTMFYHPVEAPLFNYLVSSFVMLLFFVYVYSRLRLFSHSALSFLCSRASFRNIYVLLLVILLCIPFAAKSGYSLHKQTIASLCMVFLAFLSNRSASVYIKALTPIITFFGTNPERFLPVLRKAAVITCFLLLGLMGFEAFSLIKGPVHVLNEYLPLPSTPLVNGEYINISDLDDTIEPSVRKKLMLDNTKEYFYQLANRGVFNHIGHVLSPVNEYLGGKPPSEIYFQYGLGFSFVYQWTMEFFGGLAVHNYFKCHMYFILYWLLYFLIAMYLFRSEFFVLLSMLALATSFFTLGYDAFVIAPGINPLIHFFDLPLLFFLFRYFNCRKAVDLGIALVMGVIGILLNQQFGLLGMLAAVITLAMFYVETESGVRRLLLIALLPCAVIIPIAASRFFFPVATDSVFGYFLKGYFSFAPDQRFVAVVIAHAAFSYVFLLWKKNDTTPYKYLFVFLFLYFQALLVYYYWSGLSNHFWPLYPIMALQLLVMAKMLLQSGFISSKAVKTVCSVVILTICVIMVVNASKEFYREKKIYLKVFTTHKVYSWDFNRAGIVSTIDPEPLHDSVKLMQRYSGSGTEGKGVVLISVFDNILPLLAERYSLMPFFEMQWFLISKKEVNDAVLRIKQLKPHYIFVGHEVESEQLFDPWGGIFYEFAFQDERLSASGRLHELRSVFLAVKSDYSPVMSGKLLTVYKLN